jgi:hypothetical protein
MKAWVAKDKDGMTFLYSKKPKKGDEDWNSSVYTYYPINELPEGVNPQWEDKEPIEVELIIKAINKEE